MPDRISLERYVQESSFVTRYLSRVVKDKAPGRVEESVADAAGSCVSQRRLPRLHPGGLCVSR